MSRAQHAQALEIKVRKVTIRRTIFVSSLGALASCTLISCDTPVGQGAGWGAATGAIIGGAATGNARAAAIGAAAGAAAGALTGKIIQEKPSCAIWTAAARRLSYCAMGWVARLFLQPLYRSGL